MWRPTTWRPTTWRAAPVWVVALLLGGLCLGGVGGGGCGGETKRLQPPPARAEKLVAERDLAFLPSGSDLLIWVDIKRLRRWPPAQKLLSSEQPGSPGSPTSGLVKEFQKIYGLDPWKELEVVVLTAPLRGEKRSLRLVLRGPDLEKKLTPRLLEVLGRSGKIKKSRYQKKPIFEVGPMCVGFADAKTVLSASGVWVRRALDLASGEKEERLLAEDGLKDLWARLSSQRLGGAPAAMGVARLPDALAKKVAKEMKIGVLLKWVGIRISVNSWMSVVGVVRAPDSQEARKVVKGAEKWANAFVARSWVRRLGIGGLTKLLHVHSEGPLVYFQFALPNSLFIKLMDLFKRHYPSSPSARN